MTYINNLIPKNTKTTISADGDYIFFNKERTLINVIVYDTDGVKVLEKHPVENLVVLNLKATNIVESDSDIYLVSLAGGSSVPAPDATKLDKTVYNTDQDSLVVKINAVFTAIKTAADFDAAKVAISTITRTEV